MEQRRRCRPSFLGIGAQRCGTSWLDAQLRRHPQCWLPPIKELHYFDRSSRHASRSDLDVAQPLARLASRPVKEISRMAACLGQALVNLARGDPSLATWWARWGFGRYDDDWYRRLFRPGTSHPCRGEITPSYALLTSDEVGAVHALFPDLKLILMVRDPKSRAWSSLRYWAAAGGPDLDERTVRRTVAKPGFLERGDYLRTLDTYLAHFPPRQVLIGFYDAIRADPLGLLDGVAEFLGVAAFTPARLSRAVVNPAPEQEIPPPIDELLDEVFEPTVADIRRRFGSYASNWGLGVGTSDERPGPAHCPATVHPRPPGARTA